MAEATKEAEKKTLDRVIRVFVSSTFADMQAEREELVKRTFPELRRLCESRGVVWSEVDLRWGVTDEEKAEGRVLPICLAEIKKCRPYFIGLLGQRYGWVPDEIDPELIATEPWLAQYGGRSVTELEILHGVLNQPDMTEHAYFYFRDPKYLATLPNGQRKQFEDQSVEGPDRLRALKQRIHDCHRQGKLRHVPRDYADPQVLAEMVRIELREVIDQLFPEGSQPDELTRDETEHQAWARSRQRVYVPRTTYFHRLDQHVAGDGPPLVVLGESGAGKTALLANWVGRLSQLPETPLVIQHYIGATPASTDWAGMVRRVLGELNRHFALDLPVPTEPEPLRAALAEAFEQVSSRRVVIVLDGLNQLDDHGRALDLVWLPAELPSGIRLVLSTLPGRSLDELRRRGWPTMHVELLSVAERRELIPLYLDQYGKRLAPGLVELIANQEQTRNPLYLRVLLEELRVWGQHETLRARIDHYLQASTLPDLFGKVFVRWEQDYEGDSDLVGDVLSLLACARRGLSESDLMALLGADGQPLPRAVLSPLLLAAGDSLVDRSGLLSLSHEFARRAVDEVYLPSEGSRRAFHRRLAQHFAAQSLGPRKLDELPWQLARAHEWQQLADVLIDPEFSFEARLWNKYEVSAYWAQIEAESSVRLAATFAKIDANHRWWDLLFYETMEMLSTIGHAAEARAMKQRLEEDQERKQDRESSDEELRSWREKERVFRQSGDLKQVAESLWQQGCLLESRGRMDEALALHEEEERICRQLGNLHQVGRRLREQADLLNKLDRPAEAMARLEEEESLWREAGNPGAAANSLSGQADLLAKLDRPTEAMARLEEAERLWRQAGNLERASSLMIRQVELLEKCGRPAEATARLEESERVCRQKGDLVGVLASLEHRFPIVGQLGQNQALFTSCGQLDQDQALVLLQEQKQICRRLGRFNSIALILDRQREIFEGRGQTDEVMALRTEEEQLCRQAGEFDRLVINLGAQAELLQKRGLPDEALARLREQEQVCRQIGDLNGLRWCLYHQVVILRARGENDTALARLKDQEAIFRQTGDSVELASCLQEQGWCLGEQIDILRARSELDGALDLCQEHWKRLHDQLGEDAALLSMQFVDCLHAKAEIYVQREDFGSAMRIVLDAIKIAQVAALFKHVEWLEGLMKEYGLRLTSHRDV